jgi:hypothetical protein
MKKITGLLSAASATLIGASPAQAEPWDVETAVLMYSETGRVSVLEPVISASKALNETDTLGMKLTLNALTGASANGAVPGTQPQTFTSPSGKDTYLVDANETPKDPNFRDNRVSLGVNLDQALNRFDRRKLGASLSIEQDFISLSANAGWSTETNERNTRYDIGANLELDAIRPSGGAPSPLTEMTLDSNADRSAREDEDEDEDGEGGEEKSRVVLDLLAGVTQIIDRSSLFQVNLSLSAASGYMTDPYKFVSVVDGNSGEPLRILYERRPDTRFKASLFGKYKKTLASEDVLTASLRLMTDDWGVDSTTLDLSWRFVRDNGYYLQPHLRGYRQSAADFHHYFLLDGEALPKYASADYRLGEMTTRTLGIKYGHSDPFGNDWSLRLEYYLQSGDGHPSEAVGQLRNLDLFPDVEAWIFQVNYAFRW